MACTPEGLPAPCVENGMIQDLRLLQTEDYRRKLAQCIHCGLCLQACPTYLVFGTEMDSPRGRITLMHLVSEGLVAPEDFRQVFSRHISLCLACRSCETACPSGVQYGALVEQARIVVERNRKPGFAERFLRWIGTRQIMPKRGLLKLLAWLLWCYEKTGLQRLVRRMDALPPPLKAMEAILPPLTLRFTPLGKNLPPGGKRGGRVLFFTGCIQEGFLSQVNQATLRVLQRNGFEVYAPAEQTCCGAAQLHLGDLDAARALAKRNIDVFQDSGCALIINNAGGCGVSLKEYPHLLAGDPVYAEKAREFAGRVRDISEFLAENLIEPPRGAVCLRATYADSCHLRHGQKVVKQPRELLQQIPGLELVELQTPDRCCGSAGVYNLVEADTANRVLDEKMSDIASTGAELIITTNTGCHLQLIAGVRRAGLRARVMHLVEVLDLSYQRE